MKKAIIIFAHQKPEQVNILLSQLLLDKETDIYIHVNKLCSSIIDGIMVHQRVKLIKNNYSIHWGSDEILHATISIFKEIIETGIQYEYFLIISGQDILVKKNLDEFLSNNNGKIYIDLCNKPSEDSIREFDMYVRARVLYKWPERMRRRIDFRYNPVRIARAIRFRLFKKGFPYCKKKIDYNVDQMVFYKDFYWCALPVDVVTYILGFLDDNPGYMSIYHEAYQPEEGFISTLIINSGYLKQQDILVGRSLTFTRDMENNHAPLLSAKDIKDIEESGMFFARKFDIDFDKEVIDYFVKKTQEDGEN